MKRALSRSLRQKGEQNIVLQSKKYMGFKETHKCLFLFCFLGLAAFGDFLLPS